jgi:putative ABC transport system permease protein
MYPVPITRLHGRDSRESFLLLQAAVGIVLLIACANIANILLARGASRQHELAVRISLGASRRRLLSSVLAESLVLAAAGGGVGLLLAMWGIRLARATGGFPDVIEPTLNPIVLLFTAAVSMLTGVLSGIVPAVRASAASPNMVLKSGDRAAAATPGGRLRAGLVALQIALAVVLGTCGLLMLRSLVNRQQVDLGFEPRGGVRAEIALAPERYADPATINTGAESIVQTLQRQSGVVAAGASTWALPTPAGAQRQLSVPAADGTVLPRSISRAVDAVTPDFFAALGVPLRTGRTFTEADKHGGAAVAIINEELAQRLWPGASPLGQSLRLGAADEAAPVVTVIGVVGTVRRSGMHDRPTARVYLPFAQYPSATFSIVVRTRNSAAAAMREIEAAVHKADPLILVEQLRTLDSDVAQFLAPVRMMTLLLGAFGSAGVLLAALGIFGMMSYAVSQRQRELALRTALGATKADIVRLVFGGAARITAAGIALGGIAAAFAARLLAGFVFGVTPSDPLTLSIVAATLGVVSLVACYRPARRAASVDPLVLLRE